MLVQIVTENGQKKIKPLTADAGAGLPVGFIAPAYKKGNYSGWLYLDGRDTTGTSEELSTHYPLLYDFLGSNVLPDYREVAITGAEENTTDTIAVHDVFTQGEFKDDQLQKFSIRASNSVGGYGNQVAKGGNTNVTTQTIDSFSGDIRAGDVTRGKRKAVFFYIKATSGLSENAQDNVVAQLQNITVPKPKLESYTPITLPTSGNTITLTEGWYSLRAGSTASSWIDITIIVNAHTIPVCSARNNTSGSTIAGTTVYIMAGSYDVKYSGSVELNKLS